jgi:squalene-hopene/tetraprenyl-beta-curcumene cyclase
VPQAPAADAARAPGAAAQEPALDVTGPIRAGLRWLRSVQDPVTGAYAANLETTALVVRAFAESPDRYRASDGPFVARAVELLLANQREDGSIGPHEGDAATVQRDTRAAAEALIALGDPAYKAQLGRALAYLGSTDLAPTPALPEADLGPQEAAAFARGVLAAQKEPGKWDGPRGQVHESAWAIVQLSAASRRLDKTAEPGAPPVVALPAFGEADRAAASAAIERGADFLAAASQDGTWGAPGKPDAGLTAMVLAAMQARPAPRPAAQQALIDAGLAWLAAQQKPDGSIHDGKLANYITSASIFALQRSGDPRWKDVVARARAFLVGLQADEGEGYSEGDLYYGGIGYGSTERPDLSNLQMALEALAASGLEPDAPTYRKALKFLERCQNRSESNDLALRDGEALVRAGDDGGASYAPGDSKAGFVELEGGVKLPRSYGSMTYALVKCMLYAGLPKDDPRLVAAIEWCRKNYTLDVNPGFDVGRDPSAPYQGLYYYLHTLAQALAMLGEDTITDGAGRTHAWRREVCGRVLSMQSKIDGSWTNRNSPRWMEGNPLLGTAYALLTLDAAMPPAAK